jgi:hypothetical protein
VTADPLADPAELSTWLGVPADDVKLLAALDAASRRFRGAVRHPITLVVGDNFTLDGTGRRSLLLPASPVSAVTSLKLDGTDLVDSEDFEWSADGYLRRLPHGCVWPDRLRCVEGVYSHGYQTVPADIAEVVIDQARTMYRVQPGVQSVQVGGQQVTFGAQSAVGVTAQWSAVVAKYRLNREDEP